MSTCRLWVVAGAALLVSLILTCPVLRAQDVEKKATATEEEKEKPKHALQVADDDAKKLYESIKTRVTKLGPEQVSSLVGRPGFGQQVGSHIAPMLETCVWGFRYSGDLEWLKKFEVLMSELEKALVKDPDGQLGWYSAAGSQRFGDPWPPRWPDTSLLAAWQQSEARVTAACAEFEMTVRDAPEAKSAFAAPAARWVKLAEEQLMPKWDKTCYVELSRDRAVYTWPTCVFRAGEMKWEPYPGMPSERDNITLPHPAISEIILQYLKLWQLKGTDAYRRRAAKLLGWQKSCLRFPEKGRRNPRRRREPPPVDKTVYWWNYWDPAGDWDFKDEGGTAFGMYMSIEPTTYGRDVEALVEGYHSGVDVDEKDLERLIKTQLTIMMTGDPSKPTWKDQTGQRRGMLWPQLAEFDEKLAAVLEFTRDGRSNEFGSPLRFMQEQLAWAGWTRRKTGSAEVISFNQTYEDFREDMENLLAAHPPPDPTENRPRPRR